MTKSILERSLPILLASIIVLTLGLPYTKMWFYGDACGDLLHAMTGTPTQFFAEGNPYNAHLPDNVPPNSGSFISSLYRPLGFCYQYFQIQWWGDNPYCFFLASILLHALIAILLLSILLQLTRPWLAFGGALFFSLHPSVVEWVYWIAMQQYFIETLSFVLLLLSLYRYLQTNKIAWYLVACFFYMHCLFLREQLFIWPIALTIILYFWRKNLTISVGFWLINVGYLYVRSLVLPLVPSAPVIHHGTAGSLASMKLRWMEVVSMLSDVLGLAWLPSGNRMIKGGIMVLVVLTIAWLLRKVNHNVRLIFALGCVTFLLCVWPSLILCHRERYIYTGLLIMTAVSTVLIDAAMSQLRVWQCRVLLSCLVGVLLINTVWAVREMQQHEERTHWIGSVYHQLIHNHRAIFDAPCCFYAIPLPFYDVAQHIKMLGGKQPVYCVDKKENLKKQFLSDHLRFITWDVERREFVVEL